MRTRLRIGPFNPTNSEENPYSRIYTPKIYGFKVSEYAKTGPRMKWIRMRPSSLEEIDKV